MTHLNRGVAHRELWVGAIALPLFFFLLVQMQSVSASPGFNIYDDDLAAGWQDWSWDTSRNLQDEAAAQSGAQGISVDFTAVYGGLYLRSTTAVTLDNYDTLRFWLHGGHAGQQNIAIKTVSGGEVWGDAYYITAVADSWVLYEVPLASLGNTNDLLGVVWQNPVSGSQPTFYLDEISLVSGETTTDPTATPTSGEGLVVDVAANQRSISPHIYGMNFSDAALQEELQLPLARWGGNATTRYNWQLDTTNRASDWYFENIPNDVANESALPYGSSSDNFVAQNRRANGETLLTIPMIGYTAMDRERRCGFSVEKYGGQQSTDPWAPDCGNGIGYDGQEIRGNDPADTSMPIDEAFVQEWLEHLVGQYGTAVNGGVQFYNLDNEPMLWSHTHRDIHPEPASYDEIRNRTYQYGAAVKAVDPSAQTLGPVVWGWPAYFYSAADGDWWMNAPDREAHGGKAFLPWYLQEMAAYEAQHGVRILDYLDIHYYPQQNGVALTGAGGEATQALRLRSTRALWDATYVDESWINEPVNLIPRMQDWIETEYPGTKLAISEYNWGGLEHLNGALTQADVLGIYGREGVNLATLWDPPKANQPGAYAFRMYLNYDGNNGRFGDTSVYASSPNHEDVAIYASLRSSDGALLLLVINKTKSAQTLPVLLNNFAAAEMAEVYRYSHDNLNRIVRQSDIAVTGTTFNANLQAESMTLFVLAAGSGAPSPTSTSIAPTSTATAVPPTVTSTELPPTATNTAAPPTATATTVPPTPTATTVPPTATNTTIPPTSTTTNTAVPPTATATTVPPTATATSVPSTATAVPPTPTNTPQPSGSCTVTYHITNDWRSGMVVNLSILNQTGKAIDGWTLEWQFADKQEITNLWNGSWNQNGKAVFVSNAAWNASIPNGATLYNVGFVAQYRGKNRIPTTFMLNGLACDVN